MSYTKSTVNPVYLFFASFLKGDSRNTNAGAKNSDANMRQSSGAANMSQIAAGTVIEGTVKFDHNVRLDGIIKGDVECTHKLVMGKQAKIEGTLKTQNMTVEGAFEGTLTVKELLQLASSAKVSGSISAGKLQVDPGAILDGDCQVGNKK